MAIALIETEKLRFAYGAGHWAVDGISFSLLAGERVAVLGANGAGKSTFLHLLMGLQSACEGSMRLLGQAVARSLEGRGQLRRTVGLVLQDPDDQLFAETVLADVIFGPLNAGLSLAAAEERGVKALQEMDILPLASRRISTLSLGEKKKVAIAGVLAMEPQVLLLDEPTAGLDHHGAEALLHALRAKNQHGVAIVIATHNTDLALDWADRVFVLQRGALVASGRPQQVLADPELCDRTGLRQPLLCQVEFQLRQRFDLEPASEAPATPAQLADWLEHSWAARHGVIR